MAKNQLSIKLKKGARISIPTKGKKKKPVAQQSQKSKLSPVKKQKSIKTSVGNVSKKIKVKKTVKEQPKVKLSFLNNKTVIRLKTKAKPVPKPVSKPRPVKPVSNNKKANIFAVYNITASNIKHRQYPPVAIPTGNHTRQITHRNSSNTIAFW
ncbi:hypothetical protein PCE1_003946 [Barthelona sp. PCE]